MLLGLDLNDSVSQISYIDDSLEQIVPVTLSTIAGGSNFEVPTVLGKLSDMNSWVYGEQAVEMAAAGSAVLVEHIVEHAINEDIVVVDGNEFSADDLLLIFVRRMLFLSSLVGNWQEAAGICICVERFDHKYVRALKKLAENLAYPAERIHFISRAESFFEFEIHQNEELWRNDVVLFDYMSDTPIERVLTVDRSTKPAVCRVSEKAALNESGAPVKASDDDAVLSYFEKSLNGKMVSSVYLVGNASDELSKTTRYLSVKRRVFKGSNLYTIGAVYSALERCKNAKEPLLYLFLGKDKLKSNIGLLVQKGREEVYISLADAGVNWYDVDTVMEFYLGREKELRFLLTPLVRKNNHVAVVRLAEFPARAEHTTRVRLHITMTDEDTMRVMVKDLGFGDIFPATGAKVMEEIQLESEI